MSDYKNGSIACTLYYQHVYRCHMIDSAVQSGAMGRLSDYGGRVDHSTNGTIITYPPMPYEARVVKWFIESKNMTDSELDKLVGQYFVSPPERITPPLNRLYKRIGRAIRSRQGMPPWVTNGFKGQRIK